MANPRPTQMPIAVVGMSCLFPGSTDANGFWRDILSGRDLLTEVPPSHWLPEDYFDANPMAPDKTYCKRGAFLQPVDFDPMAFGIPPAIMPATDTAQLLALIVAQKVLDDASQGQFANMDRDRMSVILGVTSAQELMGSLGNRLQRPIWLKAMREAGIPEDEAQAACERIEKSYVPWQESSFPGVLGNVIAGRIANRFDLRGTNCITDAACASSLSALSMGVNELITGQSDMVITGGVDAANDIFMFMCFSKTPALSRSMDCIPFDEKADGTMLGEGLAMIALKRLADAERDGDRIYAVLRGVGSSSDGRSKSVYAPVPQGQARALRRCYEVAGYQPDSVELVEAHGTGTFAGDAAEFEGLRTVFGEASTGPDHKQWCALGSVKSQIGHTKAAAGAASLFKTVMALHHGLFPPTRIFKPNPKLEVEKTPFYFNNLARPWIRDASHPRRASLSSFGFGGSNFHITLEEYTHPQGAAKKAWKQRSAPTELVLLSAPSSDALVATAKGMASTEVTELSHAARASQTSFKATDKHRLAIVASDAADLKAKLEQAIGFITKSPDVATSTPNGIHYATGGEVGGVAFLFPGQGSQYVNMGADVAMTFDVARQAWDAAANHRFDGQAVHQLTFPIPVFSDEEKEAQARALTATEWAQPAIGVTSVSLLGLMGQLGLKPDCVAGHSFGELTALHAAGVFGADSLLKMARKRGEMMRDAARVPGAMTAVQKPIDEVRALITRSGAEVVVANHNGPAQVVVSGATDAITKFEAFLSGQGVAAKRLPVATAFHSPLVAHASAPFLDFLGGIEMAAPTVDVYSNAEVTPFPADAATIRARLAEQISRPVRFVEMIEAMYTRGIRTFVEVGPGAVLTDLVDRTLGDRAHRSIPLDRKGKSGITALHDALGRLSVAGVSLDLASMWADYCPPPSTPAKKPAMVVKISGANYGKPYPPPENPHAFPPPNPPRSKVIETTATVTNAGSGALKAGNGVAALSAPVEAKATPSAVNTPVTAAPASAPAAPRPNVPAAPPAAAAGANGGAQARPAVPPRAPNPFTRVTVAAPTSSTSSTPAGGYAMSSGAPQDVQLGWIRVYQEGQRQTAEAHAAYQKAMAETHSAFLRAMESSFVDLSHVLGGVGRATGAPAPSAYHQRPPIDAGGVDVAAPAPIAAPAPVAPAPAPVAVKAPAPVAAPTAPAAPAPVAAPAPAPAAPATITLKASVPANVDLKGLMLGVVSEKTGYPMDMLDLKMELEADLGIDSIKRVEILSAMRERMPGMPEVKAAELASLRTLGQIAEYMDAQISAARQALGDTSAHSHAPAPAALAAPASAGPALGLEELKSMMLTIVAEKTGYPTDMLDLKMELEADLGIDSIKRVEILSAMRERLPGLPEVKAAELASLRTLGQIADYMDAQSRGGAPAEAPAAPATPSEAPPTSAPQSPLAPVAEAAGAHAVERFVVRAVNAPAPGLGMAGLRASDRTVVTDDGGGVADALVEALAARGLKAEKVEAVPADASAVIFLGGLRAATSTEQAIAVNREAFRAAKAVSQRFAEGGGVFVTVQDTGGDFGLSGKDGSRAWLAGVGALARTTAIEWPGASVKAIDVERGRQSVQAVAERIAGELLGGGSTLDVGLKANGERITLQSVAEKVTLAASSPFDAKSVVVASGGARGVTATCLVGLAQAHKPRIVILGRTALEEEPAQLKACADDAALKKALMLMAQAEGRKITPAQLGQMAGRVLANREVQGTLAALRAAGSEARYVAADIQDAEAVNAALEAVRDDWGPITAIVHGAGVLADKRIEEKTQEQFDRVFDTKVLGLRALLDATANDPLNVLCVFSSIVARTGNAGQCDYAMANDVLNHVACAEQARRGAGFVARSLGWGPWAGGMVTPALKAHFDRMGVPLIPLDVGARMMVEELDSQGQEAVLVIGGAAGEGALGGTPERLTRMEIHVDSRSHAYLSDHAVAGVPVVPVALVTEWFARAARAIDPGHHLARLRDLRVLRGIKLDRFSGEGHDLGLTVKELEGNNGTRQLGLELHDAKGAPLYSAVAELTAQAPASPAALKAPGLSTDALPAIYGGTVLFHGPAFQVLEGLDGASAEGIAGTMKGVTAMRWGGGGWVTDPAAVDGALQLALLWAQKGLGGASLPMGVGSIYTWPSPPPAGPIHGTLLARQVQGAKATCDITLTHGQDVIAELRGVELIRRPDA